MTPPPSLIDAAGRPLRVGTRLGGGGEGDVYALPDHPAAVVKVYRQPPSPLAVEKLTAMAALATPRLLKVAAWPTGLVSDARTRRVAGFVMPRVPDSHLIQSLYNPAQRLRSFPRAGWSFQVRSALNLAAAFDEVHQAGCLVADVNQSNALVSPAALVTLIDCDSFQVRTNGRQYLCDVGVPQYTPPELQGQPLRGVARTENHDRFGLAVLIYQLLFVGRHPYMGIYSGPDDPSFDWLIAEYRFAQGPDAPSWQMAPPPHVPTLSDLPPALGALFRRAFERKTSDRRPTAGEWHAALQSLDTAITTCPADAGHTYWRGAGRCVWCRLAAGGVEYYYGVAGGVGTFAVDEAALREVLKRLEAVTREDFRYDRERFMPRTPPTGRPHPPGVADHLSMLKVVGIAAILCAFAVPLGCVKLALGAVGLLGSLVFGAWFAVMVLFSPFVREWAARRAARDAALIDLEVLEGDYGLATERVASDRSRAKSAAQRLVTQCRGLGSEFQRELARVTANAEAAGRLRHLRLHPVADASIPKVGAGRKQALADAGILTAADVTTDGVMRVPGFGPAITANVVGWRDGVLETYRFDPAAAVSPAEQAATVLKFRGQQQQLLNELGRHLTDLEALAPAARVGLETLLKSLRQAVGRYEQARADLRVMSGSR